MGWFLDNLHWVITSVLAVYAAAFTTIRFLISRREKRKELKVGLGFGHLISGGELGPDRVLLPAANPGEKVIQVCSGSIGLPDGSSALFPFENADVRLPHDLEPEKSMMMWVLAGELARGMKERGFSGIVKLRGAVQDAVGRRHWGPRFAFNVDLKYDEHLNG